ncbi:MAG: 1-acyl-sn-glycerol-3-phosphate acyltransferase [Bacteroidales bacterium]
MNIKLGSQEKFSVSQFIFVNTWFRMWWRLWYRKVTVHGRKHLYTNKPLIVTPNHQNAAMDALVLIGIQTRQIVWLSRADIFKSKFVAAILRFFKMIPVYRMQDGVDSLGKNEEIFNKCVQVLEAHKIVGIFPEATHWGYRRLRALKKAVPRIAFLAEELSETSLDIHIVPVGIYYESYVNFRSDLFVNIGEPFSIAEYVALYKENKIQAINALRRRMQDEMKKYMLHINHEGTRYEAYEELRKICAPYVKDTYNLRGKKMYTDFQAQKMVIEQLDELLNKDADKLQEIEGAVTEYAEKRSDMRFREWILAQNGGDEFSIIWNSVRLIVGFPLFVLGFIIYGFPFKKTYSLAQKMADDVQFHNSISFSLGFLIVPILYSILAGLSVWYFGLNWWMFFVIAASLLFVGIVSFDYFILAKKTYHMIRYKYLKYIQNPEIESLISLRTKIIDMYSKYV